jgi:ChrR Cupin-like domain
MKYSNDSYYMGMQAVYTYQAQSRCHVFDMGTMAWQATDNPGLWLKPVRMDNVQGHYLGLVRFDADARSGLHQHQGVATSFVVQGGLTDYHGAIGLHEAGINTLGSTHDAVAHAGAVLVSRLEAAVTYPVASAISGVHAGSRYENFVNPNPLRPPEINVPIDQVTAQSTGIAGIARQTIFDYAGTGSDHRMVQLAMLPGASAHFQVTKLTEMWVRGGNLTVNMQGAHANCFVVCEPGARVHIDAPFGALLLAWAQGRESYNEGSAVADLFGFGNH